MKDSGGVLHQMTCPPVWMVWDELDSRVKESMNEIHVKTPEKDCWEISPHDYLRDFIERVCKAENHKHITLCPPHNSICYFTVLISSASLRNVENNNHCMCCELIAACVCVCVCTCGLLLCVSICQIYMHIWLKINARCAVSISQELQ